MIRKFNAIDARMIDANDFTNNKDILSAVFADEEFLKHTLLDENGKVISIICFKNYWGNNWIACFIMSKEVKPIHARELKKFVDNAIIDLCAERVQTDSIDCPVLNKWHKFLGFELEGTRKKMIFGDDYNMWGRVIWD